MSFGQAARGAASFFPEDRKELGGKSYMIWVYGERSRTSRISHTLKSIICENSMVHCTFSQIILSVLYMALYGTEKHNHSRISRMVVSWPWPGSFNVPFHQCQAGIARRNKVQQEQFWAPRLGWHAAVKSGNAKRRIDFKILARNLGKWLGFAWFWGWWILPRHF